MQRASAKISQLNLTMYYHIERLKKKNCMFTGIWKNPLTKLNMYSAWKLPVVRTELLKSDKEHL